MTYISVDGAICERARGCVLQSLFLAFRLMLLQAYLKNAGWKPVFDNLDLHFQPVFAQRPQSQKVVRRAPQNSLNNSRALLGKTRALRPIEPEGLP